MIDDFFSVDCANDHECVNKSQQRLQMWFSICLRCPMMLLVVWVAVCERLACDWVKMTSLWHFHRMMNGKSALCMNIWNFQVLQWLPIHPIEEQHHFWSVSIDYNRVLLEMTRQLFSKTTEASIQRILQLSEFWSSLTRQLKTKLWIVEQLEKDSFNFMKIFSNGGLSTECTESTWKHFYWLLFSRSACTNGLNYRWGHLKSV